MTHTPPVPKFKLEKGVSHKIYSKAEVIHLAKDVLGLTLDPKAKFIPQPILEQLGVYREWNHYVDLEATA
jgi:hypothetical protein